MALLFVWHEVSHGLRVTHHSVSAFCRLRQLAVYDQAIVMGGVGILTRYAVYCNELKTHRSLGKDAPVLAPPSTYALIASEQVVRGLRRSASGARGIAVAHREAFR